MQSVRSSTIKIKATEFPSFLYPVDADYNPNKPLIGLLRGPLLVRVSVLIRIYLSSIDNTHTNTM
jgi:hypothetical protein